LVVSDYSKGFMAPTFCQTIVKTAKKYSKKVVVDPKNDFISYKGATIMKPNVGALERFASVKIQSRDELEKAGNKLLNELSLEALLVTEAEKGMTLFQKNNNPYHMSSLAKKVVDVIGAGDSVIATLVASLAAEASYPDAAKLANLAGALKVGKKITSVVTKEEIEQNLNLLN